MATNASILAAFERMWHHIVAALGNKINATDPNGTGSLSINRKSGTTVGKMSVAVGNGTTASGSVSYAEGSGTTASASCSHAEGYNTTASGTHSHAEGTGTTASGTHSHAEGYGCTASGEASHAGGFYTRANDDQHTIGHYNDDSKSGGDMSGTTGSAFVIGNGTPSVRSNAFRVSYAGQVIGKSSYSTSGADYAEYFEWSDGNLDNEDRVGYFVTFDDGRFIRKANEGDYVLGVVSGNPSVLGNYDESWAGMNETDEWGRFVYVEETGLDELTGDTYEYTTFKINPDYDSSIQYVPRSERTEWDAIGMIGMVSVRDDGTCKVNGYCKVANGGIATCSDTGYRVIERVSDNVVKVILK